MVRIYVILAVITLVGGGAWATINRFVNDAAIKATQEIAINQLKGENVGLKVAITEKTQNNDALRRANNKTLRTTRDAKQSSAEGLNDDTHTETTYINSFNRFWASAFNGLYGEANRTPKPDND